MTNRKSTIRDVAKAAGVSIATVSYVLKGTGRVSESTIKRVWQVINDLNYSPNPYARKLFAGENAEREKTGLVMNIGYWPSTTPISEDVHKDLLYQFDMACRSTGYIGMNYYYRHEKGFHCAPIVNGLVDGVLLGTAHRNIIDAIRRRIPAVLVNANFSAEDIGLPVVLADVAGGFFHVLEHLRSLGITGNVAVVEGVQSFVEPEKNLKLNLSSSYQYGAELAGMPVHPEHIFKYVTSSDTSVKDSVGLAEKLAFIVREQGVRILASASFDLIALMSALREKGIRLPEDLVIVSEHNGCETVPDKVTMYTDFSGLYQKAMEVLDGLIKGEITECKQYRVPFKEIVYLPILSEIKR